ncbi:MAG: hypothetical protein KGJ60_01700 [Verrucomicrobiota bacterium]|nr:hypothetical protein [Verrucomicrobiota bacterium]
MNPQSATVTGGVAKSKQDPGPGREAGRTLRFLKRLAACSSLLGLTLAVHPARADAPLTLGTTYAGSLTVPGQSHTYTFTGAPGQQIYLDSQDADNASITLTLLSPSGTTLYSRNDDYDSGPLVLTESGTYKLVVNGTGATTGSYQFRLLDLSAGAPLALGTILAGQLSPPLACNVYRFNGTRGQRINLQSLAYASSQAQWELVSPVNTVLASGQIYQNLGAVTLPLDGPYYLLVSGVVQGATPFSFQVLLTDVSDAPATASGFGVAHSGTIGTGQTNSFSLTAPAGLPVYLDSLDISGLSLVVDLIDPFGKTVFSVSETADAGPYILPRAGTYTLQVRANNGTTSGNYDFRLLDLTTSLTLPLNTTVSNVLSAPYQTDVYQFAATNGERLFYDAIDSDFDNVQVELVQPDGATPIHGNSDSDAGPLTIPFAGTNYLFLQSGLSSSPNYVFQMLPVDVQAALPLNADLSGTLATNAVVIYQLAGTAGEQLYFNAKGVNVGGAYWTLYRPDDAQVAGAALGGDFEVTLGQAGQYVLVLSGGGNAVTYTNQVNTFSYTTNALTLGAPTNAVIVHPGDQVYYTFAGSAGQRLYFDSRQTNYNSIQATLFSPTGQQVFTVNSASDAGPMTLTQNGAYTLVFDGSGDTTGTMAFNLLDLATAPVITTGTLGDTLSDQTQARLYHFNGTAGQRLALQHVSSSASQANWELVGLDDQILGSANINNNIGTVTLPATGAYGLVVAGNAFGGSPVSFQVSITDVSDAPPGATNGFGVEHSGNIASGQTNSFTLTAPAGLPVYFDSLDISGQSLDVDLIDPYGNTVFTVNETADAGPYILPRSGTYTLDVRGYNGTASGNYDFRLLDLTTSPVLPLNAAVSNTLAAPYQTQVYQFSGAVGQRLFYDALTNDSDYPSVAVQLENALGVTVWQSGDFQNDSGPLTLAHSETYYLLLKGKKSPASSYNFQLLDLSSQPPLPVNAAATNALAAYQSVVYQYPGVAGQQLYFHALPGNPSGSWMLSDPNNNIVSGGSASLTGDLEVTLPVDGVYALVLGTYNGVAGTNVFKVNDYAYITNSYALGTAVTNTISEPGEQKVYTFNGVAGQRLYYDALAADPPYPNIISVELLNPQGAVDSAISGRFSYDRGPFTLSESGTYTLIFNGNGASTGTFAFDLLVVTNQPVLPVNAAATNALAAYQSVVYQYSGVAGQQLYFHALPGNPSGSWTLSDPNNNTVSGGSGSLTGDLEVTLPLNGVYALVLGTYNGAVGTNVFQVNPFNSGETMVINSAPVLNPIAKQIVGEGNTLTFTAAASDSDGDALTFSLDPGGPAGAAIGASSGVFSWTPPVTGFSLATNVIVRVTDNGAPSLSAAQTVSIEVISGPVMMTVQKSAGSAAVFWRSAPGKNYQLQFKNKLTDSTWTNIGGNLSATNFITSEMDATVGTNTMRFYRVGLLNP